MKFHLNILILLLTVVTAFIGHLQECAPIEPVVTDRYADVISNADRHNNCEATLNDGISFGQTFSLRPQRVSSSSSGKNPVSYAGNAPVAYGSKISIYNIRCLARLGKERTETAPFQSDTSSAYYVFALRRILC